MAACVLLMTAFRDKSSRSPHGQLAGHMLQLLQGCQHGICSTQHAKTPNCMLCCMTPWSCNTCPCCSCLHCFSCCILLHTLQITSNMLSCRYAEQTVKRHDGTQSSYCCQAACLLLVPLQLLHGHASAPGFPETPAAVVAS